MSYTEQNTAFASDALAGRITQAIFKACLDIAGENSAWFNTAEHASKRQELVRVLLNNNVQKFVSMRRAVIASMDSAAVDLSDPSNETNITDASIDAAIASVWDDQAGVVYADTQA